jgi:YfiH family protein
MNYNREVEIIEAGLLRPTISGFTVRSAGDVRKIQTIKDFLREQEIEYRKLVVMEQIHSVNIGKTSPDHVGEVEQIVECDGVISKEKGACLTVRVADCVPILFYDPVAELIGASHQGWRGTVKNMVGKMVDALSQAGSRRENILIAIGPSIGMCCYTIDQDRYVLFMEEMERFESRILKPHGDAHHLNLLRLNYELALEAGIEREHIDYFPYCTSCDRERFFSFRRHKATGEPFGEMMGFIMLP